MLVCPSVFVLSITKRLLSPAFKEEEEVGQELVLQLHATTYLSSPDKVHVQQFSVSAPRFVDHVCCQPLPVAPRCVSLEVLVYVSVFEKFLVERWAAGILLAAGQRFPTLGDVHDASAEHL